MKLFPENGGQSGCFAYNCFAQLLIINMYIPSQSLHLIFENLNIHYFACIFIFVAKCLKVDHI